MIWPLVFFFLRRLKFRLRPSDLTRFLSSPSPFLTAGCDPSNVIQRRVTGLTTRHLSAREPCRGQTQTPDRMNNGVCMNKVMQKEKKPTPRLQPFSCLLTWLIGYPSVETFRIANVSLGLFISQAALSRENGVRGAQLFVWFWNTFRQRIQTLIPSLKQL